MNVLIVTALFPPEPVVSASISFDIAEELSKKHNIYVIAPKPSRPNGYIFSNIDFSNKNFSLDILETYVCSKSSLLGRLKESYSFGRATKEYIEKSKIKFDIIYINTWPLIAQFLTIKTSKKYRIKSIIHIQDIYPESLLPKIPLIASLIIKFLLPIDKFILQNANKVITISNGMKNYLLKTRYLSNEKIKVVFNWQDETKIINSKIDNNNSERFTFLYLGSLSPAAALDNIILSFIDANLENCKLIIAGNGNEKGKLEKLSSNNLNKNIFFIDAPSYKVGEIQSKADVLILGLRKGASKLALPSKLTSYMFTSKPIIAAVDVNSDIAQIIIKSNCGWVVSAENKNELSEIYKNVYNESKNEIIKKGQNAFKYGNQHFSKERCLSNIIDIIENE